MKLVQFEGCTFVSGGVTAAKGFTASGIRCGIRAGKTKKDIGLIATGKPVPAAAVYTQNKVKGAPIFVTKEKVYNSTVNDVLARHCRKANIPVISIHGLRHTHASLLLFAGVSIASVARRLGHSNMTTTQKTYLHIIHELENQDVDLVMRSLSGLS